MTYEEITSVLFSDGHDLSLNGGVVSGTGRLDGDCSVHVLGIVTGTSPGIDEAVELAGRILDIAAGDDKFPILMLIDSGSQRMSRRDELLGLSESLAHLGKTLRYAEVCGHRTIGVLYGGSAAGAFIASALACGTLIGVTGAHPAVMDLPSMARVTKLSLEDLKEKATSTPVFAPGLDNLVAIGAVTAVCPASSVLREKIRGMLREDAPTDNRAASGKQRGGRLKAFDVAKEVQRLAVFHE
jgi:malonate decarboxylase gamma subunit